MEIFGEMRFDGFCARTSAMIGGFAAALIGISLADGSAMPYAAGCAGVFLWGLCACGMLTLYFNMLAYSTSVTFKEWVCPIFSLADSAALALKLLFVLAPFSPPNEDELFLRFAALTADVFLSRRHLRHTREKAVGY